MDGPDADVRIEIRSEEVRVHAAFNLAFADAFLDLPRADPGAVGEAELAPLRAGLVELVRAHNTVEIDGVAVTPLDRGCQVLPAPAGLIPLYPRFGARALTKVELALDYPAKSPPGRVRLAWGLYPPNAALATPDGAPPLELAAQLRAEGRDGAILFRADAPEHVWVASGASPEERFLPVPPVAAPGRSLPVLALGLLLLGGASLLGGLRARPGSLLRRRGALLAVLLCGGAALARGTGSVRLGAGPARLTPAEAIAVFQPLHANIYRAFDYDAEGDVYDALARSVAGPLLDETYTSIHGSLVNSEAGGARSRVESVELLETDVLEPAGGAGPAFDVVARWRVSGSVFHFGHSHDRTNEYRARYGVVPTDAGWRIAACRVLEERRVGPEAPSQPPPGAEGSAGAAGAAGDDR
jgi:hypothetical protein